MPRITLLTDFGTGDGYVGAMKGILASNAPSVPVDDITHDIPPGDVAKAAWVLSRYWCRYPEGTVHLVVVDPGVGTARRGLGFSIRGRLVVAPDNGVVSRILEATDPWRCVALERSPPLPSPASRTFHGRDLFAPASALLATGMPLQSLGPPVSDPVLLPVPLPGEEGPWAVGEVVEVDRFGNLATNLPVGAVRAAGVVEVGGLRARFRETYGEGAPGDLVSLVDSEGRVEIAVRDGSAEARIGGGVGLPVRVRRV